VDELEQFRAETREWLEANCPESMRKPMTSEKDSVWGGRKATYDNPDAKLWLDRMGEKGWTTPVWPKEYGGGGLTKEQNRVLQSELRRINARNALTSFGISMLGPVLLEYASEEQKKRFIPPIVKGEIRWCQGYSEPNAGSDLASLACKAEDKGDHWLVNGQKVWTSYADESDWIFCLVRSEPDAGKREGISFLLFDMESEGVSVRPIQLISGNSPFCEAFFQNVQVPKENLIGKRGGGWTIAKALLQHERAMIAGMGSAPVGAARRASIHDIARDRLGEVDGRIADPVIRDQIAQADLDGMCFGLTMKRSGDSLKAGQGPGHVASMFKYYGTEFNKRRMELMISVLGVDGLGWEGEGFSPEDLGATRTWLRSKGNSIEGGTSEIQLNVIAKRVLGLPD
jgi:alkylation response protein AidB-like acyl-CoA dehydrogenase